MKHVVLSASLAVLSLSAQSPDAKAPIQFEVAAFKHTADPSAAGLITHMAGERGYHGVNMPLLQYIMVAYQVRASQISGPDWLNTEFVDVEAKAEHTSTADELHQMLQHLLEERLHMTLHRETRQESGYALVVDTGGPKLKDHDPEDHVMLPLNNGPGQHAGRNVSMQYLAFFLSQSVDQPVVDKTGLPDHYDFTLTWGYDGPMTVMRMDGPNAMPPPPGSGEIPVALAASGTTIYEALRKQLGLRLDKTKVPAEYLVIDHIEKLSDN
jgi:uncharacterized protein (TIGR03435 family)